MRFGLDFNSEFARSFSWIFAQCYVWILLTGGALIEAQYSCSACCRNLAWFTSSSLSCSRPSWAPSPWWAQEYWQCETRL